MNKIKLPFPRTSIALASCCAVLLSACGTISPMPYGKSEIRERVNQDRLQMYADQEPMVAPITFHEAAARSLKYNLDYKLKLMEDALAGSLFEVSKYEMLPRVVAALRPFTAPVGVEAFEGLRRACRCGSLRQRAGNCRCGADAHNALLDQCIAAHVAALGEAAKLKADLAATRSVAETGIRADALVVAACADDLNDNAPSDALSVFLARRMRREKEAVEAQLAALRSAILDGPDPTEKACPRCGLVMCDRERLGNVPLAEMTREQGIAAMQAFNEAELDCYTRPVVDWRARLAKLREVAR